MKAQLIQYGFNAQDEDYVNDIVAKLLKDRNEVQRIQQQVVFQKLIDFYKQNVNINTKKVTFDEFVKLAFPE